MYNVGIEDLEKLKALSDTIATKKADLQQQLANINSANEELEKYWQGVDAKKYFDTVKEQALAMQSLVNVIGDCATTLNNVKTLYENVQNTHLGQ